jgi:hypothetical protein
MCVQIQQTVIIGGDHRSGRRSFRQKTPEYYVAAATDIEGERPAIHDDTDTGLRETVC